jgi:hypothetical protein
MTTAEDTGLVEMAWDPITRIVGSLGIYTKIDFKQKKVVECHSTSSIFRGYSIFMIVMAEQVVKRAPVGGISGTVARTLASRATTRRETSRTA